MIYFSGFCLRGEAELFADWLMESDYAVAGFSLGAIRALEFALQSESRIDRLLLFSPAFFQTLPDRFAVRQLRAWDRDPEAYRKQFFQNCAAPSDRDLSPYAAQGSRQELAFLLDYRWEEEKLRAIRKRGTVIEVFVGEEDRIIDAEGAMKFFAPEVDALYRFRHAGHILTK
ncbi:pimelyl-ACP methyl ester esterase BioV [Nitratifractor sp.]